MRRESATKGFVWKTLEQFGTIAVQFVLQIVLARILAPEAYGVIAIIGIFIALANVFVQSGFSSALVQKKQLDEAEISSVFNLSLIIAAALYLLLYLTAPAIARFFSNPELSPLLRVFALGLFPGSFNTIQLSLLRRQIKFKAIFIATFASLVISGAVGIAMAYGGLGVWTLVWQSLLNTVLTTLILTVCIKWYPRPILQLRRVIPLINFGWKVLFTSLVAEGFSNLRTFVIGKMYAPASLAFFNRGRSFPDLVIRSLNGSLQAVLLPVLSKEQDDQERLSAIVSNTISVSTFAIYPLLAIMMASAEPFITVLLTDKWLPCVPYLHIFCIYFASWPITTSNIQAILACGHSGKIMKVETLRKVLDLIVLLATLHYGVMGIAIGAAAVSILTIPLYVYPAKQIIGYSISRQMLDIFPSMLLSAAICPVLIWINGFGLDSGLNLAANIFAGLGCYIALAYAFRFNALKLLRLYINNLLPKRQQVS